MKLKCLQSNDDGKNGIIKTTILHKLQTRTSEDEAFEEYFEYFMDMEENFIENGC